MKSRIKSSLIVFVVGIIVFASSAFLSGKFAFFLQLIGFGIKGFGLGLLVNFCSCEKKRSDSTYSVSSSL